MPPSPPATTPSADGAPPPMYYAELPAAPELAPWIAAHWFFRVRPDAGEIDHTIPLTGGAMLSVEPGRNAMLVGPRTEPLQTRVHGGDRFFGSHLWPGAAASLLGLDGRELEALAGGACPAATVLGEDRVADLLRPLPAGDGEPDAVSADCHHRLPDEATVAARLDSAWASRVAAAAPLDEAVMDAVFRLLAADGDLPVTELAASAGLSERHFRRRFRAAVGLSPKELARVQRMRSSAVSLVRTGMPPWVALALDHGYADQAHLVREYRRLLGTSPTGFRRHVSRIEHGRLLR